MCAHSNILDPSGPSVKGTPSAEAAMVMGLSDVAWSCLPAAVATSASHAASSGGVAPEEGTTAKVFSTAGTAGIMRASENALRVGLRSEASTTAGEAQDCSSQCKQVHASARSGTGYLIGPHVTLPCLSAQTQRFIAAHGDNY